MPRLDDSARELVARIGYSGVPASEISAMLSPASKRGQ